MRWRPKRAGRIGQVADLDKRVDAGRKAMVESSPASTATSSATTATLGMAPDLTGYASREWLTAFISNPADERFYRDTNDRMPAFAAASDDPAANRLSPEELDTARLLAPRRVVRAGAANQSAEPNSSPMLDGSAI